MKNRAAKRHERRIAGGVCVIWQPLASKPVDPRRARRVTALAADFFAQLMARTAGRAFQ